MSLVYLSGNPNEKEVIECKEKLIEIGHSVIVAEKFDWNILCRCDNLVTNKFGENDQEFQYAFEHGIIVCGYKSSLPELEKYEVNMPSLTRITMEISMKQYRDNLLKMNFGEFISNDKVLSVSYEEMVV